MKSERGKDEMSQGKRQKAQGSSSKNTGVRYKVCEVDNSTLERFLNALDETSAVVSIYALNQLRSMVVYKEPVKNLSSLKEFANIDSKNLQRKDKNSDSLKLSQNKKDNEFEDLHDLDKWL